MTSKRVWYVVYSEDGRCIGQSQNFVSAFLKGLWFGWRCYFALSPQRVVIERWETYAG